MKQTKTSRLSVIAGCIMLVTALSCGQENRNNVEAEQTAQYISTIDSILKVSEDSVITVAVKEKEKRDSLLINLRISKARIQRDSGEAKRFLTTIDQDGILALWAVHHYFSWGELIEGDIAGYEIIAKALAYIGLKKEEMNTWGESIKKSVKKFSSALSIEEKKLLAKSLFVNATLIDSLVKLTDKDLTTITNLLDTIALNKSKNYEWLYSKNAEAPLLAEYKILRKVWNMPVLIKGGSTEGITSRQPGGHYYLLGKYTDNPFKDNQDYFLIWNTRYWNRYQYAIGMFHRRCIDVKAISSSQKREVAKNMANAMKVAGNMLLQ
jgi:hypothetical protein